MTEYNSSLSSSKQLPIDFRLMGFGLVSLHLIHVVHMHTYLQWGTSRSQRAPGLA